MVDFYALLGVSRAASAPDVERAYRRLARRYHPGVNPGDRVAEEMYRQVQEAYRVLGDAQRRREYDRGSRQPDAAEAAAVAFEGFDFSAPAEGPLAATFSELFADVFQHAAREATTPTRGADVALVGPRAVRRRDAGLRRAAVGDPPRAVCRVCGSRPGRPRGGALPRLPRRRHAALGARTHGVHQAVRACARATGRWRPRRAAPAAVPA